MNWRHDRLGRFASADYAVSAVLVQADPTDENYEKIQEENNYRAASIRNSFVASHQEEIDNGAEVIIYRNDEEGIVRCGLVDVNDIDRRTEETGGSSTEISTNSIPTSGYMIGAYSDRETWLSSEDSNDPIKRKQKIAEFIENNKDALSKPNMHLGTWKDPETGKICLDISERETDEARAMAKGRERNQKAIFNLSDMEDVDTGGTGNNISGENQVSPSELIERQERDRKAAVDIMQRAGLRTDDNHAMFVMSEEIMYSENSKGERIAAMYDDKGHFFGYNTATNEPVSFLQYKKEFPDRADTSLMGWSSLRNNREPEDGQTVLLPYDSVNNRYDPDKRTRATYDKDNKIWRSSKRTFSTGTFHEWKDADADVKNVPKEAFKGSGYVTTSSSKRGDRDFNVYLNDDGLFHIDIYDNSAHVRNAAMLKDRNKTNEIRGFATAAEARAFLEKNLDNIY